MINLQQYQVTDIVFPGHVYTIQLPSYIHSVEACFANGALGY